jgi:hypothetical protein
MKKFKLKFNKVVLSSIILIIALAIGGTIVNVISLTRANETFFDIFLPVFSTVLMLAVVTFALCMLFISYYTANEEFFVIRSGALVTKISLSSINEIITVDTVKGKKLAIYYGENNTRFFIQINESEYNDFCAFLINKNPKISYTVGVENQNSNKI